LSEKFIKFCTLVQFSRSSFFNWNDHIDYQHNSSSSCSDTRSLCMRRLACSIGSICSLHLVISWAVLANAGDNSPKQLAAVTICDGRRLWKLANQRVSVLNPWWGGVSAAVAFKEFFRLGSTDMIRWRRLDGSRSCERFGHIDILVDSTEYRVVDGSEFHVEYDDLGSQGNMAGHLRLDKNIFSLGPLEYEYTAVLDSWCMNFTSLSPW
ncbi:hypothetical protein BOX15_Mlig001780g1, partial [Macrostomum lignano]